MPSSNIYFAGLAAAPVTRSLEDQLIRDPPCELVTMAPMLEAVRGAFTQESKAKVHLEPIVDLNSYAIFN